MNWGLAVGAALVIVFAAVSRRLDRAAVTPAIFFVAAGLAVGNETLGWIDYHIGSEPVRLLAEVTLTLILFADASRVNVAALRREYNIPLRLLAIGLPLTIAAGTVLALLVITELSVAEALILAIIVAPTDAALGQVVVTDDRVPSRIRQGLNVESGLNDGICVPLLLIALVYAEADEGLRSTSGAVRVLVEQVGYGLVGGIVAGIVGAALVRFGRRRGFIEPAWLQILPAATAGLAYGIAAPLGGSGFIAAFAAGFLFGALHERGEGEVTYLVEEAGELLNASTFLIFGATILGPALAELTWEAGLYAVLSLTAIRMVPVAVAAVGTGARLPTIAFLGWFGPRGLASIVFAVLVIEEAALPHIDTVLLAVVATIALSVYAHGFSARPLTDRYVSWYRAHPDDRPPPMESVPAPEQRWRGPIAVPTARMDTREQHRYHDARTATDERQEPSGEAG